MRPVTLFAVVLIALEDITCQQPLDDISEISPYLPSENLEKKLLRQCESFSQSLTEENEKLKKEVDVLKMKIEALEEIEEEEEEEEDEENDGKDESNESEEPRGRLRKRRDTLCRGKTLSPWMCDSQCILKLKQLCGISFKNNCHC